MKMACALSALFLLSAPALAVESAASVTADDALRLLKEGNERYTSEKFEHPNQSAGRRQAVVKGQTPFVTVIGCSDSRAPVEEIFDRGIGDIFVVRVAGNVSDTDEVGTAEYGAGHLNTPLIVVLGHTRCGAVTAVATGAKVGGSIPKLVDNIIPAAKRSQAKGLKGDEMVADAITENVWQSITDLFTKSEEIRELVHEGKAQVIGAVYDLESGKVEWLGHHPNEAKLLAGHEKPGAHETGVHKEMHKEVHEKGGHKALPKETHKERKPAILGY